MEKLGVDIVLIMIQIFEITLRSCKRLHVWGCVGVGAWEREDVGRGEVIK